MGIEKHLVHLLNTRVFNNFKHFLISINEKKHCYFAGKTVFKSRPLHFLTIFTGEKDIFQKSVPYTILPVK